MTGELTALDGPNKNDYLYYLEQNRRLSVAGYADGFLLDLDN